MTFFRKGEVLILITSFENSATILETLEKFHSISFYINNNSVLFLDIVAGYLGAFTLGKIH